MDWVRLGFDYYSVVGAFLVGFGGWRGGEARGGEGRGEDYISVSIIRPSTPLFVISSCRDDWFRYVCEGVMILWYRERAY